MGLVALAALGCFVVVGGVLAALAGGPDADDGKLGEPTKPPVGVALVTELGQRAGATFSGVVTARDRARLAFEVDGRLPAQRIELGRRLEYDEEIARIEASGQQAELDVAQARVQQSALEVSARLDRLRSSRELALVGVTGDESVRRERYEVGIARARRSAAQAERTLAKELADGAVLRAPFSGIVTRVWSFPGELVRSGEVVVEVQRDDVLELELSVPEEFVGELAVGHVVMVTLPRLGREVEGTVRAILPAPGGRGMFPIVLDLPGHDAGLFAGASASVTLSRSTSRRPAVPVESIVDPAGSAASVFVVEDGRAQRVTVDVVGINGDRVLIEGSLEPGQHVVTEGAARLAEGAAVRVMGGAL